MVPCKDYDDYTKYINENNNAKKNNLLMKSQRTASAHPQPNLPPKKKFGAERQYDPFEPLKTQTPDSNVFKFHKRGMSMDQGQQFAKTMVKPKIIESRISEKDDFCNLSDGFKRIFGNDKKDRKIIIPVVGYGGHRRGDRSQNFFGKSFRETTIQSKAIERQFRTRSMAI